ncbi:MAG: hypothetical protein ACRD3J_04855 [Thermoanaerobaculia bacterium]
MRNATMIVVLLVLTGCAHAQEQGAAKRSDIVLLRVISAADNATRIPGAEVFSVGDRGALTKIGSTDTYGEIKVKRAAVTTSTNAVAIVVCHPVFFCGALRSEYIASRDEATLALARAVSD